MKSVSQCLSLRAHTNTLIKFGSLTCLTLQNTVLVLLSRYVRSRPGDMFISSSAVTMSEVVKMLVCIGIIWLMEERGSLRGLASNIYKHLLDWRDNLLIGVPGVCYAIQNNLIYVAVSHLDSSVFQVTYQLKVFTTVLFFRILLHRVLTIKHMIALFVLFAGVVLVQIHPTNSDEVSKESFHFFGIVAVVVACLLSGFSGVFFELVLKTTQKTIAMRNLQLAVYGAAASVIQAFFQEHDILLTHGFFFGYDGYVWMVILVQSLGGLLVAAVVRYADNVLKTFATSVAIVLTFVISVLFFGTELTVYIAIGNVLVVGATILYGILPPPALAKTVERIVEAEKGRVVADDTVTAILHDQRSRPD